MIEIVGAPWDACGYRLGSRLGPPAVRLAHLAETIAALGLECIDHGDVVPLPESTLQGGIRNFEPALESYRETKSKVFQACSRDSIAIVLGGDHSNSIGSVSGALEAFGDGLAVLWIDAHMDLNSPATSPSGNLHGMPVGALTRRPFAVSSGTNSKYAVGVADSQWSQLLEEIVGAPGLREDRIGWFATRDVDPGEQATYRSFPGSYMATMYDIDRFGIVEMLSRMESWLYSTGAAKLWVSFDVDCLDPFLAPGTGTAVRGGLTYREMHLMGELLHEILAKPGCSCSLAGLDVVEVNPIVDSNNATAKIAVEWIASLFGKRILGGLGALP